MGQHVVFRCGGPEIRVDGRDSAFSCLSLVGVVLFGELGSPLILEEDLEGLLLFVKASKM